LTISKEKNIFILDDDQDLKSIYKDMLESFGYTVDIFNNYSDAKKAVEEKSVDYWGIYIIDLKIPLDKNDTSYNDECFYGFHFIEEYLPLEKTIIISGYSSPEINNAILSMGPLMSFTKPLSFLNLIILINAIFKYYIK